MHGRPALLLKALAAAIALSLLAGCERPRIKSYESDEAATMTNPARDFKKAPLDPYSWGGIAMATGGRDSRTTYGAMSPGTEDGVDEVYLPGAPKPIPANRSTQKIYNVPDPRLQNKTSQYLGSTYIDNEADADGAKILSPGGVIATDPDRAQAVRPLPDKPEKIEAGE